MFWLVSFLDLHVMMMVEEAMSLSKVFCLGEDSWSTSRDVILVFIFTFFNSYL